MEALRKKADDLYFEACRKKYGERCMICGRRYDKAHHFFCKGSFPHLRYNLDNGVNLCMTHHSMIHQTGEKKVVENQIIEIRGKDWFNDLRRRANNMPHSFKSKKWYQDNIIRLKEYIYEKNQEEKNQ